MKWIIFIIVVLSLLITNVFSQIILNPSMEGPVGTASCPPSWYACGLYSSPDTQPGQFNVTKNASQGSSYVSLVTRGSNGNASDNYCEAVGQTLNAPLLKDQCYIFKIDLMCSSQFTFDSFGDLYYFTNYTILKLWGSDSTCKKSQLLIESAGISNRDWNEFSYVIKPLANYTNIILEAYYVDVSAKNNGNLCMDNIRLYKTDEIALTTINLLVPNKEDSIQLSAPTGYSYNWLNNAQLLSCNSCQSPFARPINSNLSFTVQLTDDNSCGYFQVFNLEKEIVFPEITISEVLTPNGDGKNDVVNFDIKGECTWSAQIFNRWGSSICRLDKNKTAWDGTYNGGPCPSATYYYVIEVICKTTKGGNTKNNFTGFIQVVR